METVIIVVHLMVVVALVAVVMLQKSEGGALGIGGGGGGGFMTGRGTANMLTRTTTILAAAFFVTSITLTLLSRTGGEAPSVFDSTSAPAGTPAGETPADGAAGGNVLDQIRKLEEQQQPATPPQSQ